MIPLNEVDLIVGVQIMRVCAMPRRMVKVMSVGGLNSTCVPPDSSEKPSTAERLSWALRVAMIEETLVVHT